MQDRRTSFHQISEIWPCIAVSSSALHIHILWERKHRYHHKKKLKTQITSFWNSSYILLCFRSERIGSTWPWWSTEPNCGFSSSSPPSAPSASSWTPPTSSSLSTRTESSTSTGESEKVLCRQRRLQKLRRQRRGRASCVNLEKSF